MGANLAEMANIGLPVPPGFTITCQTCMEYANAGNVWPEGALDTIAEYRADLEERMGKRLGDAEDPLLVSVRSGAPFSMPGMMDTVLNLGLNDESINGLIKQTDNPRFAWDSYRRFIQMFSNVVMGLDGDLFENAIVAMKNDRGVASDTDLTAEDLQELVDEFKAALGDSVEDVRMTLRLTDSPSCIVTDPNGLDPAFVRMMKAAGQDVPEPKPILELNPNNPLVSRLKEQGAFSPEWAKLFLEQAQLMEGEQLKDPAGFINRMNTMLMDTIGKKSVN